MKGKYGDQYDTMCGIPAMTPTEVHDYLIQVGENWEGDGVAVECGSWLGATCAALCIGLEKADYERSVYCFDRWKSNKEEVGKAVNQGQEICNHQNLRPTFLDNVGSVTDIDIQTQRTKMRHSEWCGEDIDIFLLDAAKSSPQFEQTLDIFGPHWVDGAVVGFMDFYFARKLGRVLNQEHFVQNHSESFERIKTFDGCSCAFFRYLGGVWE